MAIPPELLINWMPQSEALKRLGLSRSRLWEKRKQGLFECRRVNGRIVVRRSDVDRYLSNLEVA